MSRLRGPTGIYWGELACLAAGFSGVRTIGWEPAVYTVRCLTSDVVEWGVKHDAERFLGLGKDPIAPQVAAALTAAAPARWQPVDALPYRATLVVRELRPEAAAVELKVADLFLVEARVVDGDSDPQEIELVLADVRRFWRDYGELTQDFNLPVGTDEAGAVVYAPTSVVFGGEPWRAALHVSRCLAALPGQPELAFYPPYLNPVSRPLRAVGASPLEVAKQVVADARLVFALNLDGTASLLPAGGEGALGECPGGVGPFNSATYDPAGDRGVWKGEVTRNLLGRRAVVDAPDEVVVVGPPPVYTARIDYLEPVLPYEQPVPGGGTVRKLLPVTPDLLDQLVAIFSDPAFAGSDAFVDPNASARLRRVLDSVKFEATVKALVLRAPFLGDEWPLVDNLLPRALRDLLRERLWRFWRVPERFRRYLPVMDRAERFKGRRLPPLVQAFGWKQVEVELDGDDSAPGVNPDAREAADLELQAVEAQLGRVRQKIAALEVTAKDAQRIFAELFNQYPRIKDMAEELERRGLPSYAAAAIAAATAVPQLAPTTAVLLARAPAIMAQVLKLQNPEDFDPVGKDLEGLRADQKALEEQRAALLAKTDPIKAAEDAVAKANAAWVAAFQASGVPDAALGAALTAAVESLARLRADRPVAAKRKVKVTRCVPAARAPVDAVVDEDGLVELAAPAGWPSDCGRADVRETYLVPLPVALTFGTWALPDRGYAADEERPAPLPEGIQSDNAFVQAGIDLLNADDNLRGFAADFGHVLPKQDGGALRLTFSRQERKSGRAQVGPWPFRITARGDDERMQVLYPASAAAAAPTTDPTKQPDRQSLSNFPAVLAEAAGRADAVLSTAQVRDAGSIEVLGPRPVNCDGKASAVRWESDSDGNVTTTVYVDPDAEPVPGFEAISPATADTGPTAFGIDLGPAPRPVYDRGPKVDVSAPPATVPQTQVQP